MESLESSFCLLHFSSTGWDSTTVCKPVSDDLNTTTRLSVSWLQVSKIVREAPFGKVAVGIVKILVVILVLVVFISLQVVVFGSTGRARRRGFHSLLKRIFRWKLPKRAPEPVEEASTITTVDDCEGTQDNGKVGSIEAAEAFASVANCTEPTRVAPENVATTKSALEYVFEYRLRNYEMSCVSASCLPLYEINVAYIASSIRTVRSRRRCGLPKILLHQQLLRLRGYRRQ